jgi:LAO/AO transport system kinase
MEELSKNPNAFIRPTASGNALGGVASKTREALLLCEAAGFDVIIVETVGVGQSEVAVKNMVDFFLLLVLAGAGDELQGIKKGIMEMADGIVITKADGDNVKHATEAQAEYQHALHLSTASRSSWQPRVLTASALLNVGIEDVWKMIVKFNDVMKTTGSHDETRRAQNINWFRDYFESLLENDVQQILKPKRRSLFYRMTIRIQLLIVIPFQHNIANPKFHFLFKQRPIVHERVKLSSFTARIDTNWQFFDQFFVYSCPNDFP